VNSYNRIASGTDNPGHCNKKATVCVMRSSTHRPLPDMFRKIFGQWESRLDGQWMSNCWCNTRAVKLFFTICAYKYAPPKRWAGRLWQNIGMSYINQLGRGCLKWLDTRWGYKIE
jgi:hypothetical protein